MEKNIPNDNLEKFLQRALEDLEENPSAGLWGKIAANLPPPVAPITTATRLALAQKWAAGIAAVLLIGFSTFQFFHHKAQITRLSEELDCTQLELRDLQERTAPQIRQQEAGPNESMDAAQTEIPVKVVYLPYPGTFFPALQNRSAGNIRSENAPLVEHQTDLSGAPFLSAFEPVPLSQGLLSAGSPDLSIQWMPPIEVLHQKSRSRWSVGVQGGAGKTTFTHTPEAIPFQGGHGHENQEDVKIVNEETVVFSRNVNAGFTVNYGLGRNWAMATGLQYRRYESRIVNNPQLKFGDREGHEEGPGEDDTFHFNYYLNIPSGTMLVTLNAEKTDPDEMISNHENVDVSVTTDEKLEFVSVPMVLGYQVGQGRISGQLRAGLLANIGLGYQSQIGNLSFENPKFRSQGKGAQLTPPHFHPVSFDYYFGAGLACDLSPAWRLILMPSLSGSLTRKIDGLFSDPSDFSLGAAAELNYRF